MGIVLVLLGCLFAIGSFICSIIILIDAFKDAIWKGLVALLCGLYFLYYALFEFEHQNKWMIVLGSLLGGGIASALITMSGFGSR